MMKRYKESFADLNKLLVIKPNDMWTLSVQGETLSHNEESFADFKQIIRKGPNNALTLKSYSKIGVNNRQLFICNCHYNIDWNMDNMDDDEYLRCNVKKYDEYWNHN